MPDRSKNDRFLESVRNHRCRVVARHSDTETPHLARPVRRRQGGSLGAACSAAARRLTWRGLFGGGKAE